MCIPWVLGELFGLLCTCMFGLVDCTIYVLSEGKYTNGVDVFRFRSRCFLSCCIQFVYISEHRRAHFVHLCR